MGQAALTSLLEAIRRLPTDQRDMLGLELEYDPKLTGDWTVKSLSDLAFWENIRRRIVEHDIQNGIKLARREKGPKTKSDKTAQRNEIIHTKLQQGVLSENEIYEHLKVFHYNLLAYGKSKKPISLENMMKKYRASEKSRKNCNRTGTTAIIP